MFANTDESSFHVLMLLLTSIAVGGVRENGRFLHESVRYTGSVGRVWPVKDSLTYIPPQFSRLGTEGPASHVLCDFVSV